MLTPGNVRECKVAKTWIAACHHRPNSLPTGVKTAKLCTNGCKSGGTQAVFPLRRNREIQYEDERAIYKQRNVIARMFCRLKDWRRIATRFDRNIKNFLAAIAFAAAVIWWL